MESDSCPEGDPEHYILNLFIGFLSSGDHSTLIMGIISVITLLFASALVSASEAAFYSLKPADIELLKSSEKKKSKRALELLSKKDHLLSTILISNNLINVAIVITSYFIIAKTITFQGFEIGGITVSETVVAVFVNVTVVTSLIVLMGELAPKVYAQQNRLLLVEFMSSPLLFLRRLFWIPNHMINYPVRIIEQTLSNSQDEITIEELNRAIDITAENEVFKQDVDLLKGIVHFGNTTVKQIMRSRVDIEAVSVETNYLELMQTIKKSGYSRFPVYEGDVDTIIGILYVKDLLSHLSEGTDFEWQDLTREAFFIPEAKKIDDLLKEIQENRKHLAIVVDEYGGTSGIVTLEDIVEEVLGEIKDEFDDLVEMSYKKIDDNNFIFEGKSPLNDVCRIIEIGGDTFDSVKGDADSLAGLILEIAGYFPKENDEVSYANFKFIVLSIGNNRIERVKITRNEHSEEVA